MISLAKFFHRQTYWAKDIIFLLTEDQLFGMKAWLQGYFKDNQGGSVFISFNLLCFFN